MLAVLAELPGRLVSKSELLERVWPGLVVEEGNIAAQIAAVRKALAGDLVATVPGARIPTVHRNGQPVAAPAAEAPPPSDRPQLFGRGDDLTRLHQALQHAGCVTLIGPGGVGKTTLAEAVAESFAPAHWCDLAPLTEASQLLPALYRALGRTTPARPATKSPRLSARWPPARCWCWTTPSTWSTPWPAWSFGCWARHLTCTCW